jgi:hypothetical protein
MRYRARTGIAVVRGVMPLDTTEFWGDELPALGAVNRRTLPRPEVLELRDVSAHLPVEHPLETTPVWRGLSSHARQSRPVIFVNAMVRRV